VRSLAELLVQTTETEQGREKVLPSLFFKDIDGKTHNLNNVAVGAKVKDVINRLGSEKSVEVDWLRFLWSGKQIWPTHPDGESDEIFPPIRPDRDIDVAPFL
jgi:hypothetical protein